MQHLSRGAPKRWSCVLGHVEELLDSRSLLLLFEHLPLNSFLIFTQIEVHLIIPLLHLHVFHRLLQLLDISALGAILRVAFGLQGIAKLPLWLGVQLCACGGLHMVEASGWGGALLRGEFHFLVTFDGLHVLWDVLDVGVVHFFDSSLQLKFRFEPSLRSNRIWPIISHHHFSYLRLLIHSLLFLPLFSQRTRLLQQFYLLWQQSHLSHSFCFFCTISKIVMLLHGVLETA